MNRLIIEWSKPSKDTGHVNFRVVNSFTLGVTTIPAGFKTDGASIPSLLRPFFQPLGRYFPAAIIHDWALENRPEDANSLFKEALKEQGCSNFTRWSFCLAVSTYQTIKRIIRKL